MRSLLRGVMVTRGIWAALAGVGVTWLAVVIGWSMIISVQVDPMRPPRGIGAVEVFGGALAVVLPVLTAPRYDGRERLAVASARMVQASVTTLVALLPLTVLPVWWLTLRIGSPTTETPPVVLLTGNLVLFGAVSSLLVLLLGRGWGALGAILAIVGVVIAQQVWPETAWTELFSTGTEWHTHWPLTIGWVVGLLLVAYRRGSVPRRTG
ncbi:hypothetical protein [Ornithinicoccus hortensis]|uniref:Uncharacterized protein n=1 Tax=Ornithinicoccus hortensis TaxID=82346 RepID=A0A542YPV6_9MICO|nr:hypothetical protein [Ornithinicoccus hortensis]TQL49954.1 hypothetical protein FB467_1051 [Ornithinicoccus hortensis]